jgi:hypothetical protein
VTISSLAGANAREGLIDAGRGDVKRFLYYPETVSFKNSATWVKHKIAGIHDPRLQYAGGEGTQIDFELHLLAPNPAYNVDIDVRWFESLVFPDIAESVLSNRAPARLTLYLGSGGGQGRGAWPVVAESVEVEHRMFRANLSTSYAVVSMSFIADFVAARGYGAARYNPGGS